MRDAADLFKVAKLFVHSSQLALQHKQTCSSLLQQMMTILTSTNSQLYIIIHGLC